MRTDHITAWLIYEWVQENAPKIAAKWSFDVEDQIKSTAQGVAGLLPNARMIVVGQQMLAKTLIEKWNLTDVALLAGGTPTPLSPRPDQIRFYTDNNEDAVKDAANAGYNALQVNAANPADLKKLDGATTAFASGLMHFLPDAAVQMFFDGLADAGFRTLVFNQGNRNVEEGGAEMRERYSKMGINMYPRTQDEVRTMIPAEWTLEQVIPQPECFVDDPLMGPHVDNMPYATDVYRVTRD